MRWIIPAILASIIIVSSVPSMTDAGSERQPLTVILTYPDGEYAIGDVVPVLAHVFRHLSPFDPDVVEFRVGADLRSLPMERMATGLYEVDLEISGPDLSRYGDLWMEVNVTTSGPDPEGDSFRTWLRMPARPSYRVDGYVLDPLDAFPEAGQVIELLVVCSYGDQLVDADPGSAHAIIDQVDGTFRETVDTTRVSTGVYSGNWTVSVDMNVTGHYYLEGWARFGSESPEVLGSRYLFVSPIDVWVNLIQVSRTKVDADIYVHRGADAPVAGANVSVEIFCDGNDVAADHLVLETGADGVARVRLDLGDIEPLPFEVAMAVEILGEGFHYEDGWAFPTDPLFSGPGFRKDGFAVTLLGRMPIPAGAQVTLELIATHDAEPLVDRSVACYFYTDNEMLTSTMARTDGKGLFRVELSTPELSGKEDWYDMFTAQFKLEDGNGEDWTMVNMWTSENESKAQWNSLRTPGTQLDVERTSSPNTYRVTLRSDGLDGLNEMVMVWWGVDDGAYFSDVAVPGWFPSTNTRATQVQVRDISWNGEAYVGTIEVPNFLPETVGIYMTGFAEDIFRPNEEPRWAHIHDLRSFLDDPPPEVEIESPSGGDIVEGGFAVRGIASDDTSVQYVLVRLDGGEWEMANGTDAWRIDVLEGQLSGGGHKIEAMSFDGQRYSDIHEIEFDYRDVEPRTFEPWPYIILLVLVVGTLSTLYMRRAGGDGGRDG